jgi:hypothetical protein
MTDTDLTLTRVLHHDGLRLRIAVNRNGLGAGYDWRVYVGRLLAAQGGSRTLAEAKADGERAADRVEREVVG